MDLSELKWLKNVKPEHPGWAYDKVDEMPIPEARIFRLHWRGYNHKSNAEQPVKGDLILLNQRAKVTHVVEFLDNEVYENSEKEWSVYRVVKAVWMPPNGFDWRNLPHQKEILGIENLPQDGNAHNLSQPERMSQFNQYWKDLGGLQGFQEHLGKVLTEI